MIPREKPWLLFGTCILLLMTEVKLQSGRTYDTSEWIPVTPTSSKDGTSQNAEQKTASDRVLSIDAPSQKFFPDEEYDYRKRIPHEDQQFLRPPPLKKEAEHPRPRKLKYPSEYKFETPPPPPSKIQPEINYYNGQSMSPYVFEQPTATKVDKPGTQQTQQSYYVPVPQLPSQRPNVESYVAVPNIHPQVPAPNAPNLYEQYQLPFNASFYQSLNPTVLNNEFYQAIGNNSQIVKQNIALKVPQQGSPVATKPVVPVQPAIEKETVQLVYVPIENLKANPPAAQDRRKSYQQADAPKKETIPLNAIPQTSQIHNFEPLEQPRQEKLVYSPPHLQQPPELLYQQIDNSRQEKLAAPQASTENKQERLQNIEQDFIQRALQASKLQRQLQDDINPLNQFATTPRPLRKPHQPPLAVFMESEKKAEVSDVLNSLRDAKTISVQDTVTPDSPKIFIGPSNLDSPYGYTKFPLPYLNNINGNRIERKIDQLPFFVAPVNYNTPPGYSKIALPSPHVGSVVISTPVTTSTTPETILLDQNQLNPFTLRSVGYSPLDPPTPTRPVQNYLDNYGIANHGRIRYQSTPIPQVTETPVISPIKDIFEPQFSPPQPDVYYVQQDPQQTYRDNVPTLDIYRPELQEKTRLTSSPQNTKQSSSTLGPKENSQENSQLPNINPLELAINEFELHQINNQFDQGNKKVKHSTTRRPQSSRNYEDSQTVSTTRATVSRGRHTYENDPSTEKPVSRGRVRTRGRGSSSRTVTTTTTTPPPEQNDRYTVLEEFAVRQPTRGLPTESYGRFSAESETEAPRRSSTTPFVGNPYLPENTRTQLEYENSNLQVESLEDRRPQQNYENIRSQTPQAEHFENTRSQSTLENTPSQTQLQEGIERELPQISPQRQRENTRSRPKSESTQSQDSNLENPQASLEGIRPQTVQKPTQYYQKNTEIENIPASVYSLGQPQTYESTHFDYDSSRNSQDNTKLFYEDVQNDENVNTEISKTARPILEEAKVAANHRFSPEVTSYENREPNQHRPRERTQHQEYESNVNIKPIVKQSFDAQTYQSPTSEIADQVLEEQKPKPQSINDPAAFIENLFQPNFDQTYLSLQDQAVRSLLVPDLLAPSPKQQFSLHPKSEHIVPSTEAIVELPSSTEAQTTTTRTSRPRGRGRARITTTSTAAPRRAAGRRKPISRTSTERIVSSPEYSPREDNERSSSNSRQNFRTKSRPLQPEISERISTTENDIRAFKEPAFEGGFEAVNNREPPQSYMQFEHAIDEQQIITINPKLNQETDIREYQVNNLPAQPTTEKQQLFLDYENTRLQPSPVQDVKVSHVVSEENTRNFDVITKPTEEEQYVKYNNVNNFRSGGVLNNNKPTITTTRAPTTTKARGRVRGRSRFVTTTKTTSRPVTRISTSAPIRTTSPEVEEQEFYGFIRQPASSQRNIQAQKPTQTILRNEEPNVQFVGEIRPKYNPRKSQLQSSEEPEIAETPRPRIRSRTRAPARKTTNTYRQSDNDVNSSKINEQATRKSTTNRGRTRGSTHYRAQEYQKRESDDEDIANQNYPVNFLQKIDVSSPTPAPVAFKITVDPMEDDFDDQSPDSSIYRPKFAAKTDGWFDPNGLSVEDKSVGWSDSKGLLVEDKTASTISEEQQEDTTSTDEPQALPVVQTTQTSDELFTQFSDAEAQSIMANLEKIKTSATEESLTTLQPSETPTTQKKSRRRGGWKLVRQRPLDPLEVSESQNYQSVVNLFGSIQKVDHYTKGKSSQNKYSSGKVHNDKGSVDPNNFEEEINSFKENHYEHPEIVSPKDVDEVVTVVTEIDSTGTENTNDKEAYHLLTTTPSTFKTQENIFDTIYEMFGMFNKKEEKKNETTTSNDNKENEKVVTTTVNPVFPDEITEESSTASAEKTDNTVVNDDENKKEDNSDKSETTTTTTPPITTPEVKSSTKPYEVEPWEMRAVKTSTSTEISHETEICYKGRCVKSKEKRDSK